MSKKEFKGWDMGILQRRFFLEDLPSRPDGRYGYHRSGLKAPPRSMVLFQYDNHIVASARVRKNGNGPGTGNSKREHALYFEPESIRVFDPVDRHAVSRVWPNVKRFGQMKYRLRPEGYDDFKAILKNVEKPKANCIASVEGSPESGSSGQPQSQPTMMERARESLRALVGYVFEQRGHPLKGITYTDLAYRIGRRRRKGGAGHGRGMGKVLGRMGHLLKGLEGEWGEPIPHLQSMVILKAGWLRGLPDIGIEEFWPEYPQLSRVEKARKTQKEYERIARFGSRWNDVLAKLKLPGIVAPKSARRFGGAGESPDHKRLKEYVRRHPEIVGATRAWDAIIEYPLPSLDVIDVLFRSADTCIAVEVKSKVSDLISPDYERGLYQTVKYAALLTAMHQAGARESRPNVKTVLVLESRLPAQYRRLAKKLGVRMVQNVRSTD